MQASQEDGEWARFSAWADNLSDGPVKWQAAVVRALALACSASRAAVHRRNLAAAVVQLAKLKAESAHGRSSADNLTPLNSLDAASHPHVRGDVSN
jgi:hypothetical protein